MSEKSVEPRHLNEDKSEGVRQERVVNKGWLIRRYNVLAEELGSSISEKTNLEKCTNCSFQAYIACKCKRASPKINTQELSNARTSGIKSFFRAVGSDLFSETPVGSIVREFVVYGGSFFMVALWLTILVGFILRLINTADDSNRGYIYFLAGEVGFSSFGMILTILDLVQHMCMHRCTSCTERTRGSEWRSETPEKFELTNEHDDKEFKGCCKKHSNYDRAGIIRFFITPLVIYPLLLLSMFQFSSEIIIGQVNITSVLSFVLIVIMQIWFVYLVRIFIFFGTVHTVQKIRTGGANGRALLKDSYFQLYFVVFAVGQMVVELLIIAVIGVKIYDEYLEFLDTDAIGRRPITFIPSPQLWYMMVFGYFATPMGLAMFFISHYYCAQRFFIKFYQDINNVLEYKANVQGAGALPDIMEMEDTFCGYKFIYSFLSPTIVLLCIFYLAFVVAFVSCSLSLKGTFIVNVSLLFSSQLVVLQFCLIGATIIIIIFVNLYAIVVACFWLLVVIVSICLCAIIVALVLCVVGSLLVGIATILFYGWPILICIPFCYCIFKDVK